MTGNKEGRKLRVSEEAGRGEKGEDEEEEGKE